MLFQLGRKSVEFDEDMPRSKDRTFIYIYISHTCLAIVRRLRRVRQLKNHDATDIKFPLRFYFKLPFFSRGERELPGLVFFRNFANPLFGETGACKAEKMHYNTHVGRGKCE